MLACTELHLLKYNRNVMLDLVSGYNILANRTPHFIYFTTVQISNTRWRSGFSQVYLSADAIPVMLRN